MLNSKHLSRLGDPAPEAQLRQALANVTLEGLRPDPMAIKLAGEVAEGTLRIDDAYASLSRKYACNP